MDNPAKRRKTDRGDATASSASASSVAPAADVSAASASAGLFRPSTFLLETAELLAQSRVDYAALLPDADAVLREIKAAMESVPAHAPLPIHEAVAAVQKTTGIETPLPQPRPPADSNLKVAMAPPALVNVVGSFVLKTMTRTQRAPAVDVLVEMPRSLFQEKDYLNLRYFYKRAYYLAQLTGAVRASASTLSFDMAFAHLGDNPLLPVLVLSSANAKAAIQIIPCCAHDQFPPAKLAADRNCVRTDSKDAATPFYNATLRAEGAYVPYLRLLHQTQKTCRAFADACLLGRTWLQQRGFGSAQTRGGFGAFEWSALVALLMQTKSKKAKSKSSVLSPSLSATQIFKAVVQFLATTDFRTKPCVLGAAGTGYDAGIDSLREPGPVVFDAGTGRQTNLAYKMSPASAGLLRQLAKRTHALLKDETAETASAQFAPTFIARADIAAEAYDMVLRVTVPVATSTTLRGPPSDAADTVFQTLKKAYGDRAALVHVKVQPPTEHTWPTDRVFEAPTSATLQVGILFEPTNMARHIDHGPDAEDKAAGRRFRAFWGPRAELRRFKDGRIQETLAWTAGQSPAGLCEEIARYILRHRLSLADADVVVTSGADSGLAHMVPLVPVVDAAAFALAREAFATLEADIRALDDVPLHVRSVEPVDEALRSASVAPPPVQTGRAALHPMEVVLRFEASGKWPDSLPAIQRAKMAFLLRIAESLQARSRTLEAYVGLENTTVAGGTANLAFLDVVYEERAAFRVRVHCDLEHQLLARATADRALAQHVRTTSAQLLAQQRRLCVARPLHTQTLATLATRFPALSGTVRLVKRWFSAHKLLATHVAPETVELLVLYTFLQPAPWTTPATASAGLLRTLQFLARWDWRTEPLVVDTAGLSNSLDDEESISSPRTRLDAWRRIDPAMNHTVLFVAATHEPTGTLFTTASAIGPDGTGVVGRPMPSKVVATRMTALARAACRTVKETDAADAVLDPAALFTPALADYDVLLHINARVLRRLIKGDVAAPGQGRSVYKNLDARTGHQQHALPAHPVHTLLAQLNQAYNSGSGSGVGPLVFFYGDAADADVHGDHVIAALWNPQVHARSFRVNVPCSFRPVGLPKKGTDDVQIEVNRDAILAEIARIGGALIDRIEILK